VEQIVEGAAMMAGVESKLTLESGMWELLVNRTGAEALQKNLELLGEINYTPEEMEFAKKIQAATSVEQIGLDGKIKPLRETMKDPEGGSTDVADVSWNTPQISLVVTTAAKKAPWHSWAVVACGGMSIGHKGMVYSSKAMGLTMVDLFENESLRQTMRAEFLKKKGTTVYKVLLPDGPPPVPENR
jgi:aminobenzoyl-glutamate utilization protein B